MMLLSQRKLEPEATPPLTEYAQDLTNRSFFMHHGALVGRGFSARTCSEGGH